MVFFMTDKFSFKAKTNFDFKIVDQLSEYVASE